jgi:UDP-glucose 4-epimerase
MGLAHLARAPPPVLALFDHQPSRDLSAVQPQPALQSLIRQRHDRPAVLATRGAGCIGSHACRALTAAGYQPRLRYFNASGADPAGGIGEQREVETHLIPRAMMALQGHVADFAVFGDDYPTPDGTAIRDYIHVTDLATAHVLALKL